MSETNSPGKKGDHCHLCPWWVGYLLLNPFRRLLEDPDRLLAPLVAPGMTALDIGCAMGFFSLPLARMVGDKGRVVCVDLQPRMLSTLERRARRRGVDHIIETRPCRTDDLCVDDLAGSADLVLAIHVVHETTTPQQFFEQCHAALRPGGRLLFSEPRGHITASAFEASQALALEAGLHPVDGLLVQRGLTAVLEKR